MIERASIWDSRKVDARQKLSFKMFLEQLLELGKLGQTGFFDSTKPGLKCEDLTTFDAGNFIAGKFEIAELSTLGTEAVYFVVDTEKGRCRFNLTGQAAADFFAAGII